MIPRRQLTPVPFSREPISLLSVDRAVSEIRRGRPVAMRGSEGVACLVLAAEAAAPETLELLASRAGARPAVVITARRAAVLGLSGAGVRVMHVAFENGPTADQVRALTDPLLDLPSTLRTAISVTEAKLHSCEAAAVLLTKIARLLPAAVYAPVSLADSEDFAAWALRQDFLIIDAGDVFQHARITARTLTPVSEARVPLVGAENARIISFRPRDGGLEHLAVCINNPEPSGPVLTRLHSECFTGDLLGSLRCDCGDQLRGAIRALGSSGGGLLLYLAQEGRGIGLVNKLRAYELQDRGFDTLDANEQLGFDADERIYLPAAEMLRHLGFTSVRLLTNNPEKVSGLTRCGIDVVERVPHSFPANPHSEAYLRVKAGRGGHLL